MVNTFIHIIRNIVLYLISLPESLNFLAQVFGLSLSRLVAIQCITSWIFLFTIWTISMAVFNGLVFFMDN